jgi:ribosomal protein L14
VIQKKTILNVVDNSGVRFGICISTPSGFLAGVGDNVLLSVLSTSSSCKLKKGTVVKCTVVRVKSNNKCFDGSSFSFDLNAVILMNSQNLPLAKRIYGPVSSNLRKKKSFKTLFLASVVL